MNLLMWIALGFAMVFLVLAMISWRLGDYNFMVRCLMAVLISAMFLFAVGPLLSQQIHASDQVRHQQMIISDQITDLDARLARQKPLTKDYEVTLRKLTQLQTKQIKLLSNQ